ncbi:hypothetical protein DXG03_009185 [Asterophora parasitica]|uniref:Uncharacterized protein n=1 Tax=Asterophora parasitica TaxID=117018 RepID=A0A9P7G5N4_9AGAR|nr:hypothetical protein DXG03_009185 [Asterophora parasitica]
MTTIEIAIKSKFRWNLIFDYDNSDNSGSIVHEFKFTMSGSYSSKKYMETVSVTTRKTAESHGLELQTGASYGPFSASINNSSNSSKELTDMLSNTTSTQTDKTLEWSNEENRTYKVGAHSRVCLYQRSFEAEGMYLRESVYRTTPEPLPKEEMVEEDTIITEVRPTTYLKSLEVYYTSSEVSAPGDRIPENSGQSSDINYRFGGKFVWLVPRYTTNTKEALTRFDVVIQPDEDKHHNDLAKGAGGKFRYLIHVNQKTDLLITKAGLLRSSSSISGTDGWGAKTIDINKGREGSYLYVVWNAEKAWPV